MIVETRDKRGRVVLKSTVTNEKIILKEKEYRAITRWLERQKLSPKTAFAILLGEQLPLSQSSYMRYARGLDRIKRKTSLKEVSLAHKRRLRDFAIEVYRRLFQVSGVAIIQCKSGTHEIPFMFTTVGYPSRDMVMEFVSDILGQFDPESECELIDVKYDVDRVI